MEKAMEKLRKAMEIVNIPEKVIQEIETKSPEYQLVLWNEAEKLIDKELINLHLFVDRENPKSGDQLSHA